MRGDEFGLRCGDECIMDRGPHASRWRVVRCIVQELMGNGLVWVRCIDGSDVSYAVKPSNLRLSSS